jgi:hypothetical protein
MAASSENNNVAFSTRFPNGANDWLPICQKRRFESYLALPPSTPRLFGTGRVGKPSAVYGQERPPQPYPNAAFGLAFARGLWRPPQHYAQI